MDTIVLWSSFLPPIIDINTFFFFVHSFECFRNSWRPFPLLENDSVFFILLFNLIYSNSEFYCHSFVVVFLHSLRPYCCCKFCLAFHLKTPKHNFKCDLENVQFHRKMILRNRYFDFSVRNVKLLTLNVERWAMNLHLSHFSINYTAFSKHRPRSDRSHLD